MTRSRLLSAPRSFLFSSGNTRPTSGIRLGFKPVGGNGSNSDGTGDTNFYMDITDIRDRRIMITFHNRAQVPCAISDIYFVDGDVFSISVQSARDADSAAAPACTIDLATGSQQSAPELYHDSSAYQVARHEQADTATMADGIKPSESLGIVFDLKAGVTLADIIAALSGGILNISLKLQGVAQGSGGVLINDSALCLSPR